MIRKHVNRYVAHLDFELLAEVDTNLTDVEGGEITAAVDCAARFANLFAARFLHEAPVAFDENTDLIATQAETLVEILRAGLKANTAAENDRSA